MVLESNTLDVLFVKDGQQGEDGKILYTWIKYAKDASGTGITDDPNGAIYIGISYNNESSIESNDPTQYAWTKIQGADGKKGEDAYTIFLENENISFATDENRNPLSEQEYTSGITIMKGAKPVTDFTIGDIAKTQGIAVAKTDTAIAISVVNGNPLPYDSGEIEIPITVGGTVFKKILTWTCAKKGEQGDKGDTGQDGQDATYITLKGSNWDASLNAEDLGLYLNGVKQDTQYSRGHMLCVIDPQTGKLETHQIYDTFTDPTCILEPLNNIPKGKIIGLYSSDATQVSRDMRNILLECGSNDTSTWGRERRSHVFIGMKGLQRGQAYEKTLLSTEDGGLISLTAYYTQSGLIVNGATGDNAKNLSITPSSQYFKSTDGGKTFAPNTITIKPTIQGEINFGKWQYSIDGGVSFADVVSGQKGLTISNNVLTVSKDSSLYSDAVTMVTFRAVASDSSFYDTCSIAKIYDVSDIGDGRNLWITRDNITLQACEKDKYIYTTTGTSAVCIGADGSSVGTNTIALQTGTKYTISFVISSPSEVGNALWYFCTALNNTGVKNYGGYGVKLVTGENIVSQTITVDTSCDAAGLVIYNLPTDCIIKDIQVEKGSSPTGWSPAPEDVQTAILSTKSEISDVSLKVDKNKQAIEQRVEKTTYQQDLNLVKGDISKANEGLNKWRYEIYPKSLFTDKPEDQSKYDIGVFIRNKNLTPSRTLVFDDNKWTLLDYENNYIGYGLTFVKMSAKKTFSTKWAHSSSCSIYVNGKLIISDEGTVRLDSNNTGRDFSCTFIEGWNCIEFVMQETTGNEWFFFKDAISAISECQLMNCYYGTPVARQSHITNQLVQNTTDIDGVTTTMQKVMTTVGGSDKIDEFVNNYNKTIESEKQFKKTIGETYTTKDEFNGLEIGGRNLLLGTKDFSNGVYKSTNNFVFSDTINGFTVLKAKLPDGGTYYDPFSQSITYEPNTKYTLSFYAKADSACNIGSFFYNIASGNGYFDGYTATTLTTYWKRYSITWITGNVARSANVIPMRLQETGSIWCYMYGLKFEKGSKATDWTPAPEDDEINGQNLVSNLPSNWEQGTVTEGSTTGTTYANTKSSSAGSVRPKELIPVSGNITISTAYSNQSKKPIRHWIAAYDVNKNYLGNNYVSNAWNSVPRTLNMKDAKYIAIMVGYTDSSAITPSDISQICLKIERGTSATPFTLAPEDVNGKIVNVETIANQTAKKFEWIVKGGDKSSSMVLTDDFLNIVANKINLKGKVTFESLSSDAKSDILNSFEVGGINLISDTRDMKSWAKGGKLTITYDQLDIKNNINAIKIINSESTAGNAYLEPPNRGPLSSGKYTVSFYAKTDSTSGADVTVLLTNEYTKTFKINNI